MKKRDFSRLLPTSLLLLFILGFAPAPAPGVVGSWKMVAHRVSPALDGITDVYTHFKNQYGGCREDMGLILDADGGAKMTPVKGCENPLGNLVMKVAAKFMPGGKMSWEAAGNKIILQDGKGQRKEYELQLSGDTMLWVFDEGTKEKPVRHTVEYHRQ